MVEATALLFISALAAAGLGSILARILRLQPSLGERGFLGLLSFGILGASAHFFVPISTAVQYATLAVGFAGLVMTRRDIGGIGTIVSGCVAIACVLFHPLPGLYHDNGSYHMPTILWNIQAPLTPGVGNIQGNFGFNSLFFIIEGFVDRLGFGFIGNSLAAIFLLLAAFERLIAQRGQEFSAGRFWFLVIAVVGFVTSSPLCPWLGHTDVDHFVTVLVVYWIYLLLEYAGDERPETVPSLVLLIGAFAAMSKLSAAPSVGITLVLFALHRRSYPPRRAWVAVAIFGLVWCARGFLQSGCGLYPVSQSCIFSLPWAVAPERAIGEAIGARSWARVPGSLDYNTVLKDWNWFIPWLARIRDTSVATEWVWGLAIGLVGLIYHFFLRLYGVVLPVKFGRSFAIAFLSTIGGIAYWFWAAPDPRFGMGYLSSFAILAVSFTAASFLPEPELRTGVIALVFAGAGSWLFFPIENRNWAKIPPIPPFAVIPRVAPGGLQIWVPFTLDMCWDTPIPCVASSQFVPEYFARVRWRPFLRQPPRKVHAVNLPIPLPIRVKAGGEEYTDSQGHFWNPDAGYKNGNGYLTEAQITGTADPELYRTLRYSDDGALRYELAVPNGNYIVVLHFAEWWFNAPGQHIFTISLNGSEVDPRLDLFTAAGGMNRALDLKHRLRVEEGQVNITITAVKGQPVLCAFEILPITEG